MKKTVLCYTLLFILAVIILALGMFAVYLIPNEALEPQYGKSIAQLETEELYPNMFFNTAGAILDNYMDTLMVKTCHVSDDHNNPLLSAMENNGYPRYWNGYLLVLRPLMTQFSYQQIRYLNLFVFLLMFGFVFSGIHMRLGFGYACAFGLSIGMTFFILVPVSLQFLSVFLVTFGTMLCLLYRRKEMTLTYVGFFFLLSGILTNFFDLLTAPLLSLGMPITLYLLLNCRSDSGTDFRKGLKAVGHLSLIWGIGYGLCWVCKWGLGTLILQKNVFADALQTAQFRTSGSEAYPPDRKEAIVSNFETFFFAKGHKPAFLLFLPAVGLLIRSVFKRPSREHMAQAILLSGTALFPCLWYAVLVNHSQLHYFYTYRIQAVTVFAGYSALILCNESNE